MQNAGFMELFVGFEEEFHGIQWIELVGFEWGLIGYLVVSRERATERLGYSYSPSQWGAGWSYLEFPNHLIGCI